MRLILTAVMFAVIATTLMGIGFIIVLSMPGYTSTMLLAAAGAGFTVAFPVAWFVAAAMLKSIKT